MIGYLLTSFNDSEQCIEAYESLVKSIPPKERFKIVVVDAGSTPDHIKNIQHNIGEVIGPVPDLSSALNTGIYRLLGYFPDNIKNFTSGKSYTDVSHVIWVHPDMRFPDFNWGNKLAFCYDFCYPLIGRMGPATRNIDNSDPDVDVIYASNQCPVMFGADALKKLLEKNGWIYDPKFVAIGGYEDWSNGRDLAELGMGFARSNLVDVWHKGMGSRSLRDTRTDQIHNSNTYFSKWGTYEQPGFEIDLKPLGAELRKAFEEKFLERWYDKKEAV